MKKPAPNIVGELKANGNGVVAFGYPLKRLGLRPPVPSCGGQAIPEETRDESVGQPQSEKREESFMPVEITGAWFRAEKGIGGRIVLGGGLRRGPSILRVNPSVLRVNPSALREI